MHPSLRLSLSASVAFLLSACQTSQQTPSSQSYAPAMPENWQETDGKAQNSNWIDTFGSSQLSELVEEAEENNFGLEGAYQRTRAAEAAARISNASRLPIIGAGLRSSESKSFATFTPTTAVQTQSHALNLNASWEIDLWNRLGQQYASSKAQYQASQYDYESLRLSLAGQVAKAWFSLIEAKTQFELAEASAKSFDSNLSTLEKRYARGLIDAFDLRLTRAQASSARAAALARRSQMDASIRSLETLLGRYPSAELRAESELPELNPKPTAGLPSELLQRRPDILAEQERLRSAMALEKSALRNWLPSLSLTASNGTLSNSFSNLLDDDFNVWSIVGDVSVALFQSGRLKAQRDQLNANQLLQLAQYKSVVLSAFREVETALRAETDLLDLEEQTQISASESQKAEGQAWQLYEKGLVDITSVLDAERRSFDSRSQLISIRNQRLQNRINLHISLGGNL